MFALSLYFIILILITIYVIRLDSSKKSYITTHFLAGKNLGYFTLALSQVAMYISSSSFIGGTGAAYKYGLSWVLLASIQIPASFFVLGIIGVKILKRREELKAVTILDFIAHSYKSKLVLYISIISLLVFMSVGILAQFIAAGKIISLITGYSYGFSITIFVVVLILYTMFGGFKAVIFTDVAQLFLIIITLFFLFFLMIYFGHGLSNIVNTIIAKNIKYIEPTNGGELSYAFISSFFILVGVGLLGIPQMLTRVLMIKNMAELKKSIVFSSAILGLLLILMHFIGFMAIAFVSDNELNSSDDIIGTLLFKFLPHSVASIFLIAPLAAIMSTVDGMFLIISSIIIKNIYIDNINSNISDKKVKIFSFSIISILALVIYTLSFNPPDLLLWIHLLSLGGIETTFFTSLIFALFARKVYSLSAISSMVVSLTYYLLSSIFKINPLGMHPIVITLLLSIFVYIVVHTYKIKTDIEYLK